MSEQEMSRLVAILADGIRVLVKRGVVELTEDQIFERARNQAQAVMGVYFMVPRPEEPAQADFDTSLIGPAPRHMYGCACGQCPGEFKTKPVGHTWSCRCDQCDTFNRSTKQKERQ